MVDCFIMYIIPTSLCDRLPKACMRDLRVIWRVASASILVISAFKSGKKIQSAYLDPLFIFYIE